MKKLILATAVVLGAAAPVLAQSQLEKSLGVEAGQFTTAELAILKSRSTNTGNDGRAFFGSGDNIRFSSSNVVNDVAAAQFARHALESRDSD